MRSATASPASPSGANHLTAIEVSRTAITGAGRAARARARRPFAATGGPGPEGQDLLGQALALVGGDGVHEALVVVPQRDEDGLGLAALLDQDRPPVTLELLEDPAQGPAQLQGVRRDHDTELTTWVYMRQPACHSHATAASAARPVGGRSGPAGGRG